MDAAESESVKAIEEEAYSWLRSHLCGYLRFDGERIPLKIAPLPDGGFVAPVMVAMLMAADTVLELPDDGEQDLHLMVSLEKFDERSDAQGRADRWRTYHGSPPDVNWARIVIDACKFRGYFIDGEVFLRPNPLASKEGAICRTINATLQDTLRGAIRVQWATDAINQTLVGVDPWGFDVRREHDIVRLRLGAGVTVDDEPSALSGLASLATP
ncbi:MAG: hypothetical protein EXS03_07625 [Phycisphaerales bacterium]|nr:hypothetical protein [Phycisphaerales bacterium]